MKVSSSGCRRGLIVWMTAPMAGTEKYISRCSGWFHISEATRSPSPTPRFFSAPARLDAGTHGRALDSPVGPAVYDLAPGTQLLRALHNWCERELVVVHGQTAQHWPCSSSRRQVLSVRGGFGGGKPQGWCIDRAARQEENQPVPVSFEGGPDGVEARGFVFRDVLVQRGVSVHGVACARRNA